MRISEWTAATCRHELSPGAWPHTEPALPSEPAPETVPDNAPSAREWAKGLQGAENQIRDALDTLARALLCDPELPLKFTYAFLMPTLARATAVLAERAEVFGEPVADTPTSSRDVRDAVEPVVQPPEHLAALRDDVVATLRSLESGIHALAATIPFGWDEATRGEMLGVTAAVRETCHRVETLAASAPDDPRPAAERPVPARPASLTVAPLGLDKQTTGTWEEKTSRRLHNFLFEAEMGALELCAENLLMSTAMPREFLVDMAVQCYDEARHATALLARFPVYDLRPETHPVSLKLWNRSRGLSLAQRLAVHQRIGEWLGVDSLIATSAQFMAKGDIGTAHLMQFMARDEVRHVAYGNKWLRWFEENGHLSVEEIDQWADDYRRTYGDHMGAVTSLPLNEQECVDAGFSPREIERLKRARQGS